MNALKNKTISEEDLLLDLDENYMNSKQLAFFEKKLLDLYKNTCDRIKEAKDQVAIPLDDSDTNDKASLIEQSSIAFRIVEREQKLLNKIQTSLQRIRTNDYGYCLEFGEPIGIARLLARPTAEYSAEIKAIKELKEHHYKN